MYICVYVYTQTHRHARTHTHTHSHIGSVANVALNKFFPYFNCCLSEQVDNYTIIVPTKCTSLLKAQVITICTFCLRILSPYMFQPTWAIFSGRNASAKLKLLMITIQ
jgi:hypothetical protein